jgi:hypothetical protein
MLELTAAAGREMPAGRSPAGRRVEGFEPLRGKSLALWPLDPDPQAITRKRVRDIQSRTLEPGDTVAPMAEPFDQDLRLGTDQALTAGGHEVRSPSRRR